MLIPKYVKVGNYTLDVIETNEPILFNNQLCYGLYDYEKMQILIDVNRERQIKEHTFIHELLHAIAQDKNLDFGEENEHIIDEFAKGLHGVIVDNYNIFNEIDFEELEAE